MSKPNLIVRPYAEIVDDFLLGLLGGVVNEAHRFDEHVDEYALNQVVDPERGGVRGITGTAKDEHRLFRPNADFEVLLGAGPEPTRIRWQRGDSGIVRPDNGTEFYVDYLPRDAQASPLTDVSVGSVTRTLLEVVSRELATVYERINRAYRSGFIDYADGPDLDLLVALIAIARRSGQFAEGAVKFIRDQRIPGSITINAGATVGTADGGVVVATTNLVTMSAGQDSVTAPVRATVPGPSGTVAAGQIVRLLQPIAGVNRVENVEAIQSTGQAEGDTDLRVRAKARLSGQPGCTIAALQAAALAAGAKRIDLRDTQTASLGQPVPPGVVRVSFDAPPERRKEVEAALVASRAAGVQLELRAGGLAVQPRLLIRPTLDGQAVGAARLREDMLTALADYFKNLPPGEPIPGSVPGGRGLREVVEGVRGVAEADLRALFARLIPDSLDGEPTLRNDLIVRPDGTPAELLRDVRSWNFKILTSADGKPLLPIFDGGVGDIFLSEEG